MSTKLKQWGAMLVAYGVVALVLPSVTGMQLRIFNLFGENSTKAAIAALVIGGIMWLIGMSSGSGSTTETAAASEPPPPPVPASGAAPAPRVCGKCGAAAAPEDSFCMQCGTALAAATAAPPPVQARAAAPAKKGVGCVGSGCLVIIVLIAAGVGWLFFGGSLGSYTAPPRSAPAIPQRVAGTLTEFPVDPATTGRLEPTNVVTQTFEPGGGGTSSSTVTAPPETFPPGINTSIIPQSATTMTSTTYRGASSSAPVNVHVLQGMNPGMAGQLAQGVSQSSGGQLQGTRLQSPQGQMYEGYSVRSATILVYILVNAFAGNTIIIYTPQPAGFEATQRLAGSVGNGRGIADYPGIMDTFGALPAAPPPGYNLSNLNNFTGNELTTSLNQAQSGLDPQLAQALAQILQAVRMLIPERGTMAQYRGPQNQEKNVLIGNYGSARKAAMAYRLLSWSFGLAMKSSRAAGFDALTYSDSSGKVMVFQKGPYIGLSMTPGNSSDAELADLARSLQF